MFIAGAHDIHDAELFKRKVTAMAAPPDGLARHQFLAATDLARATCLWEGPAIDPLRDYLDGSLEPASTQHYVAVNEDRAVGLPARRLA